MGLEMDLFAIVELRPNLALENNSIIDCLVLCMPGLSGSMAAAKSGTCSANS